MKALKKMELCKWFFGLVSLCFIAQKAIAFGKNQVFSSTLTLSKKRTTNMNQPNNNKVYVLARLDELTELIDTKRNQLTEVCRRFQHQCSIIFASCIYVQLEGRFISEFERRLAKEYEDYLNNFEHLHNVFCREELKEIRSKKKQFKCREVIANTVCNHF